jgi:hypothetical protein
MPLTDAEAGKLQSDLKHLSDDVGKLNRELVDNIREVNKKVEDMMHDAVVDRRDIGDIKIQNAKSDGAATRTGTDISDIKNSLKSIETTVSQWSPDIMYIRELRENNNKIKINVISQWIIVAVSVLLWMYTYMGVHKSPVGGP